MQGARQARREWGWAIAIAGALVALARWLDAPGVEYLVVSGSATAAALLLVARLRGGSRRWAIGATAVAALSLVLATQAQVERARVTHDWSAYGAERRATAIRALDRDLAAAATELTAAARSALAAPADREDAFAALQPLVRGDEERSVVLFRGGRAFAWAGQVRVSPDTLRDTLGIAASPFYLALYATAERGDRRAVAMALVDASAPADRLAAPIAARVAAAAGLDGFAFAPPGALGDGALRFAPAGRPLIEAAPLPPQQGSVTLRLTERARFRVGLALAVALACFVVAAWRATRSVGARLAALGVAVVIVATAPLNEFSNYARLFDPALYYTSLGGPLTASAGALGLTSALALLAVLAVFRRHRRPRARWPAAVAVALVAVAGPFLLRDLARGIHTPPYGANGALWLTWEVPLFLAAVSVLLAGAGAGGVVLGRKRGLPAWVAPGLAVASALLAPVVWQAPGQWPGWYTLLWIVAIAALALSRQTRYVVLTAATVAALGATTLVWGRTSRGRVDLAERDLASLSAADPYAESLLERFGAQMRTAPTPSSRAMLLQAYVRSDLAAAGYPTALVAWPAPELPANGTAPVLLRTAPFGISSERVTQAAAEAQRTGGTVPATLDGDPAVASLLAIPGSDGGVTVAVVAPRTHLIPSDPFARLLGLDLEPEGEPPYTVQLSAAPAVMQPGTPRWRRDDDELHGDWTVATGSGTARAHAEIELRPLTALVERGALIVLLDLAFVGALWFLSVLADGGVGRWLAARRRTWGRSYRTRITVALFAFFTVPALVFGVWSYRQLAAYAVQSRDLLVRETLRAVAPSDSDAQWVARESSRLDTPLLLYVDGELTAASDPLYVTLAPFGRFVRPEIDVALTERDEVTTSRAERIAGATALLGYRAVQRRGDQTMFVGAPARADELALGRRRRDLGILVLFATVIGALAALWLSGIAARQLARPIGSLRQAALALAKGERMPLLEETPTVEFVPVFSAFGRMASDLNASRTALEEAQRRTAAVLRNVASGVVAVDGDGRVSLANPQAEALLGAPLRAGAAFGEASPEPLAARVLHFLRGDEEEEDFELSLGAQQLRGRLTRLARGGAVVTLDDVTQLAHAQRVLAWGEMARQVAHEIKNPLTPIRLGVQHLRRARADKRVDFDRVLDQNVARILTEIDRLDEIARSFSRYGSAPEERPAAEPTDVAAVLRDVVSLEAMGGGGGGAIDWRVEGADDEVHALARGDELREVLLNVFENARLADAKRVVARLATDGDDGDATVVIAVRDDGHGMSAAVLSRVFEPHFSTRTSGSGLGLAISRRIIDGWGGDIALASEPGEGTEVRIRLRRA